MDRTGALERGGKRRSWRTPRRSAEQEAFVTGVLLLPASARLKPDASPAWLARPLGCAVARTASSAPLGPARPRPAPGVWSSEPRPLRPDARGLRLSSGAHGSSQRAGRALTCRASEGRGHPALRAAAPRLAGRLPRLLLAPRRAVVHGRGREPLLRTQASHGQPDQMLEF